MVGEEDWINSFRLHSKKVIIIRTGVESHIRSNLTLEIPQLHVILNMN